MAGIIEMDKVCFSAQNRPIVQDFSFKFEEGTTTALVGPSGCGKSTVLKLAAGVLVPTSGGVTFRDKDVFAMTRQESLAFRRESAMVFQDSALWANQSLYQILELPLLIHFPDMPLAERKSRMQAVLKEVGYKRELSLRPAALSMGEQKFIAFARAMMCDPGLLFLDEWTESLDDAATNRLIRIVEKYGQQEKNTVIFVSHDFRTIKNLADHVIMIVDGRFSSGFSREQIKANQDLAQYIEEGITS